MGQRHVFDRWAFRAFIELAFHPPGVKLRRVQHGLNRGEAAAIGWAGIMAGAGATATRRTVKCRSVSSRLFLTKRCFS